MHNKILLALATILVIVGLLKPDLTSLSNILPKVRPAPEVLVINKPTSSDLLTASEDVIKALSVHKDRKTDGVELAKLYRDLAILISFDDTQGEEIIKSTEEVRIANRLAGKMLRLNIVNKYPDLQNATQNVVVVGLGDDIIVLDKDSRKAAVDSFNALSWACYEGSK